MNSERAKNTEPCKVRVWSERCNQTNMLGDQVVCWKLGRLWLIEFLQESFGSSWRAIPSNYPKNLDSVWSGNAFFIYRWYVLTYFTVESSCYKTWVAGNHRQTVYKITLEFCERWRKKIVLDLFRDGFCICGGPFGSGMWKNWKVAALKYFRPVTYMAWSVFTSRSNLAKSAS